MNDVKKHNKEDDAWTVIEGVIYDITKWIKLHPGGKSSILKIAGKEGTKLFNNSHGHMKSDGKTVRSEVLNMLKSSSVIKKIGNL